MDSLDDSVTTDLKFSMVPEWLIDSGCTDKALRLYVVLARYADNDDLTAYPGRGLLAKRMGCHRSSVDRAVEELIDIGAITKEVRFADGKYTSSLYTIRRIAPSRTHATTPVAPMLRPSSHPCDIELEPKNVEPKNIEKRQRQSSMTDDWQPDPTNWEGIVSRHKGIDHAVELANFRDYFISKADKRVDWNASLRQWMRNADKWKKVNPADRPANPTQLVGPNGYTFCQDCNTPWDKHFEDACIMMQEAMNG